MDEGYPGRDRYFISTVTADEETAVFINLSTIRIVDEIRPGHIRLWFSESHQVNINGPGAARLLARICDRALEPDGKPLHIKDENVASVRFPPSEKPSL
jgi:hypothetical protein